MQGLCTDYTVPSHIEGKVPSILRYAAFRLPLIDRHILISDMWSVLDSAKRSTSTLPRTYWPYDSLAVIRSRRRMGICTRNKSGTGQSGVWMLDATPKGRHAPTRSRQQLAEKRPWAWYLEREKCADVRVEAEKANPGNARPASARVSHAA